MAKHIKVRANKATIWGQTTPTLWPRVRGFWKRDAETCSKKPGRWKRVVFIVGFIMVDEESE